MAPAPPSGAGSGYAGRAEEARRVGSETREMTERIGHQLAPLEVQQPADALKFRGQRAVGELDPLRDEESTAIAPVSQLAADLDPVARAELAPEADRRFQEDRAHTRGEQCRLVDAGGCEAAPAGVCCVLVVDGAVDVPLRVELVDPDVDRDPERLRAGTGSVHGQPPHRRTTIWVIRSTRPVLSSASAG